MFFLWYVIGLDQVPLIITHFPYTPLSEVFNHWLFCISQNHISTCFAENKRKKQQVGWKIRKSLLNFVNGKVPPCGMDWQNVYKVYTPFMLTKYKHWVAVMIDLVLCEIKVYDSKVSLIPDDIIKEELAPLSITLPNLLNTMDFYEEGVYANNCTRDWWCPWPIDRVDVPQQSNE